MELGTVFVFVGFKVLTLLGLFGVQLQKCSLLKGKMGPALFWQRWACWVLGWNALVVSSRGTWTLAQGHRYSATSHGCDAHKPRWVGVFSLSTPLSFPKWGGPKPVMLSGPSSALGVALLPPKASSRTCRAASFEAAWLCGRVGMLEP